MFTGPSQWRFLCDPLLCEFLRIELSDRDCLVESNFCTKYWLDKIPCDLLEAWDSWNSGAYSGDFVSHLQLPVENPYIPSEVLHPTSEKVTLRIDHTTEIPVEFSNKELHKRLTVHQYFDREEAWALIPKVVISLKFFSKIVSSSIHNHITNELLWLILRDSLNETIYTVMMAGITCEIEADDFGFTVIISGFKEKMLLFAKDIIQAVFDSSNNFVTIDRYLMQKEFLLRRYSSEGMKAEAAASTARKSSLLSSMYSGEVCEPILSSYTSESTEMLKKIADFIDIFRRSCVIDIYFHGHYPNSDSLSIIDLINECLENCPFSVDGPIVSPHKAMKVECRSVSVVHLPEQSLHVIPTYSRSKAEKSICIELYFQAPVFNIQTVSYLDLLEQILTEPFFNELRTKKQVLKCSILFVYTICFHRDMFCNIVGIFCVLPF